MNLKVVSRTGEKEKTWYRTERIYRADGLWYFSTREEGEVGPFATKEDARTGVIEFICLTQDEDQDEAAADPNFH